MNRSWTKLHNINTQVAITQYAVRGELTALASKIGNELMKENHGYPFKRITACNTGNPMGAGQTPLSFHRQVLSIILYPPLLEEKELSYPSDVIKRARSYLDAIPGGCGAYSDSQGIGIVRDEVAQFLERRDSHPASVDDIYLTNGVSAAVQQMINLLIKEKEDGLMIPIPQYPLYSASLDMFNGRAVGYYLDDESNWTFTIDHLEEVFEKSLKEGTNPRGLVIINPGNPTGQFLPEKIMFEVLQFCNRHKLVLFADEVYQENIYVDKQFVSFRKLLKDEQKQNNRLLDQQLVTFHSISKGYLGECGLRGGFMELTGFDSKVQEMVLKLNAVTLCSNTVGQISLGLKLNPPKEGEPSYPLYNKEKQDILDSLARRAVIMTEALNKLEGVSCNPIEGALYAFPKITVPPKAIKAAEEKGVAPDHLYCYELLMNTGISVVPGTGFKLKEGNYHFRTTILPQEDEIKDFVSLISKFHKEFMNKYS